MRPGTTATGAEPTVRERQQLAETATAGLRPPGAIADFDCD
jgi:hypothetical protein